MHVSRLYVVATPIGNLEDITLRALRVLREVDIVVAEDTRRSAILLQHYGIHKPVRSHHAHSPATVSEELVTLLREGHRLALLSDAGEPLVSDPGGSLVAAAIAAGLRVEAIPGPSAVHAALSVAGMHFGSYRFAGFLPRKGEARRRAMAPLAQAAEPTVLFEAPSRLRSTLEDLGRLLGLAHPVVVCRELTKRHESIYRGPIWELIETLPGDVRGEVTLVVAAVSERAQQSAEELQARRTDQLRREGHSLSEIAKALAVEFRLSRKQAYAAALASPTARTKQPE